MQQYRRQISKGLMAWYTKNFGFEEVARTEWPKGSKEIDDVVGLKDSSAKQGFLKCGNIMIEFFEYSSPQSQPMDKNRPVNNHGHTHVCVDVTNIEDEYKDCLKMVSNFMLRLRTLVKLKQHMEEIVMEMYLRFKKLLIKTILPKYFNSLILKIL